MPTGPGQADKFVHFTGRRLGRPATPHVPEWIKALKPEARLEAVLGEGMVRGFPPFGAAESQPMVCFSASPIPHLEYLLRQGWPSWGLIVHRQWLYDLGGAPVRHLREIDWARRAEHDRPWAVRLCTEPDRYSDWTDELEWRVPVDPARPFLQVAPSDLVALLVGDPDWQPTNTWYMCSDGEVRHGTDPDLIAGGNAQPLSLFGPWSGIPRWYWNASAGTLYGPGVASVRQ